MERNPFSSSRVSPELPDSPIELQSIHTNPNVVHTSSKTQTETVTVIEDIGPLTFKNPPKNLFRVITSLIWAFALGLSDGSVGVLLNYIELQYSISYSVASILWLSNAIGFILVALLSNVIQKKFGRKSIFLGCLSSIIMYTLVSTGSKYPVIIIGFLFGGIGAGICVAQYNVFIGRLEKSSTALGYLHGCYGLGASVSPLIATAFVEAGIKWNFYYLVVLGFFLISAVNTYISFVHGEDDLKPWDDEQQQQPTQEVKKSGLMKEALKNKLTWISSLFVFFYQGAEVAFGGWITTYLRDYRNHTNTSIGYVVSGYWFGLTFGRLVLTRLIHKLIGARRGNSVLIVLSILFALLTWVISSFPIEIVTITFTGIMIGPVYPLMIAYIVSEDLIPRKIAVISVTVTTAFGSSGGAVIPFLVGLISQYAGAFVVLPSFIVIFSATLCLWLMLPNTRYTKGTGKVDIFKRIW
ncbi:Bypass of stop codon protein 6 [Spathaspora sp. JA1]|nr:Bypass of stop codon protein 6 [Spathaspora sp. JA1]